MSRLLLCILLVIGTAIAEFCPSRSASRYYYPSKLPNCKCEESRPGDIIQLAECSKNTRVAQVPQYFALFILTTGNAQVTIAKGGPYGICLAFACPLPDDVEWIEDERAVSLFWDSKTRGNLHNIDASNCIKDPNTGTCGCEVSGSGKFYRINQGQFTCPVTANGKFTCGKPTYRRCGFELDGYGVGLWNTDPHDPTMPGDPVKVCWGRDFDRHQQPLSTWDSHICVAGSNKLQEEAAILKRQSIPGGQVYNLQHNGQLYAPQSTGDGGGGAGLSYNPQGGLDGSLLQAGGGTGNGQFSQSLASSRLDQLVKTCRANADSGTGSSLYSFNPGGTANQPAGIGPNAHFPQNNVVGGGSVLRSGLDNSLAGTGGGSSGVDAAELTAGQCPGSIGPPKGSAAGQSIMGGNIA